MQLAFSAARVHCCFMFRLLSATTLIIIFSELICRQLTSSLCPIRLFHPKFYFLCFYWTSWDNCPPIFLSCWITLCSSPALQHIDWCPNFCVICNLAKSCALMPSPWLLMKRLRHYSSCYLPLRDCTSILASSWKLPITKIWASSPLTLSIIHSFSLGITNHSLSVGACVKSLAQVKQNSRLLLVLSTSGLRVESSDDIWPWWTNAGCSWSTYVIYMFRNGFWRGSCGILCFKFSSEVLKALYKLWKYLAPFFFLHLLAVKWK